MAARAALEMVCVLSDAYTVRGAGPFSIWGRHSSPMPSGWRGASAVCVMLPMGLPVVWGGSSCPLSTVFPVKRFLPPGLVGRFSAGKHLPGRPCPPSEGYRVVSARTLRRSLPIKRSRDRGVSCGNRPPAAAPWPARAAEGSVADRRRAGRERGAPVGQSPPQRPRRFLAYLQVTLRIR
jgi:hypothetical protein